MDLPEVDTDLLGGTRVFRHTWDVQPGTGRPMHVMTGGRWFRGVLFRGPSVAERLPPQQPMPEPHDALAAIATRR